MNPQNTDATFAARNGTYAGTPNSTNMSGSSIQSGSSASPYYQPTSINASTIGTHPLNIQSNPTVSPATGIIGSVNAQSNDALTAATNTVNGLDQNLNGLTQQKTDTNARIQRLLGLEVGAEKQLPGIQESLGLPQQQKDLAGINTDIANQQVAYRQAQDAIRARGDISQEAQQGLLGNQQDIYGRRLADLAIRQAAANTNVAAITQAAQNKVDLVTAPIKTEINGLQNFVMNNLDNLTKDEQTKIGQIITEKNNLLTRTTANQTAISGLITEALKTGAKIPDSVVSQVLQAPDSVTAAGILARSGVSLLANKYAPLPFGTTTVYDARTGEVKTVGSGVPNGATDLISTAIAEGRLNSDQLTRYGAPYIAATLAKDPQYDFVLQRASTAADTASLKTAQGQYDSINANLNAADTNFKLLVDTAKKAGINDISSPLVNQLTNAVNSKLIGSGDLNKFNAGINTLRTEYAQVLARGGEVTEGIRSQAKQLIPDDISLKNLQGVYDYIKQEGQNVLEQRGNVIGDIKGRMSAKTTSATSTNPLGI